MIKYPTFLFIAFLFLTTSLQVASTPSAEPETTPEDLSIIEFMYTQNYIDFSDEALASGTHPEIVMTTVMEMNSEDGAKSHFAEFTERPDFAADGTVTEIDDIGDEAVFVESVDEGGDHGAWLVARIDGVIITAFVTGAPDAPEIAEDIVRFMIDRGPSDQDVVVDSNGVVTGGWADAYPQPSDIDGLSHFDPAPVTEFQISEEPPQPSPEMATPSA